MAIENRNLAAGTRLTAIYKGKSRACLVEQDDDGKVVYVLEDGRRFASPSAAGTAVMDGVACNGWRFWHVEGAEPVKTERPSTPRPAQGSRAKGAAPPKAPRKASRMIKRVANQQGVPEGQVRWFCDACMKSFIAEGTTEPETCPEEHRVDDPQFTGVVQ